MNIIDIVILVILGLSVIHGFYRGFVSTLLSVACCLLSIFLAFTFGPKVSEMVSGNPNITSTLATYTDAVARVGDYSLASTPAEQAGEDVIQKVLNSVSLPQSISALLENNLRSRSFFSSGLTTVNQYVSNTVVAAAINILSYIACFIAAYLVLSVIVSLIRHVFELPILKQLDWLAGGVFGLARGVLLLYVLFLILPVLSTIIPLDAFNDLLSQSSLAPIFQSDGFFAKVVAEKL